MHFNTYSLSICLLFMGFMYSYSFVAYGQESLENIRIDKNQVEAIIQYDLKADEPGLRFRITPYYIDSLDKRHSIHEISGDAGHDIEAGDDKVIHWYYQRELDVYLGKVKIEMEYEVLAPQTSISLDEETYKRASKILVDKNAPGDRYEIVDSQRKAVAQGVVAANRQGLALKIPHDLPLHEDYRIRIWNDAQTPPKYTSVFHVKRKIPWALRAVGIGLVLGTAYYLLKPENNELPTPYPID